MRSAFRPLTGLLGLKRTIKIFKIFRPFNIKNISQSTALRNISRLGFGSILAQAIVTGSIPILTRLYSPDALGVASLVTSAYAFLVPLMTLKYDQAVLIPKSKNKAKALGAVVMIIATINSLLVSLLIVIYLYNFPSKFQISWFLLPAALWIGAGYTLMQQWSARLNCYIHYSRAIVISASINTFICTVCTIFVHSNPFILIFGFTAGMAVALAYTIKGFDGWPYVDNKLSIRGVVAQMKKYKSYPTLVLPTVLVSVFSASTIPLLFSQKFSLEELGLYAIANRVVLIPAAVIGSSLSEAIRCEFATVSRSGGLTKPVFMKFITPVLLLASMLFGIIYLIAPYFIPFALGVKYYESASIVQSLVLAGFSLFVSTPFFYVCSILFRPSLGLLGQILFGFFPIFTLVVMLQIGTKFQGALIGYSASSLVGAFLALVIVYRTCSEYDLKYCMN